MILYTEYKDELCLILVDENRVEHSVLILRYIKKKIVL